MSRGRQASTVTRQWWRDDITGPQRAALQKLSSFSRPRMAGDLTRETSIKIGTLRALHRYGLLQADADTLVVGNGSMVEITPSGREAVADGN